MKAKHVMIGVFFGILMVGLMASVTEAQRRPDFSGVWKLDPVKSDFAGEGVPTSKIDRIEQKGNKLDVTTDEVMSGNPVHGASHYTLDGKECVNDVLGNPLKASVTWDRAVMVMRTWGKFGDVDVLLIDKWSLSPDGKVMTVARHFEGHGIVSDQTLIFDKQ